MNDYQLEGLKIKLKDLISAEITYHELSNSEIDAQVHIARAESFELALKLIELINEVNQ